ncbi:TRAP transporter permease [Metabacillus arenae]|uniref:TRAP transporter fused permease subunit n=1 Tax=Metabacillus arenae TaxID=2771434 RepID=A0A926RWN5_9BACI|nr:TRAP transporter fused permease subunit [Metabacillus arenae]MBD1380988.1 TRAP transporter fused permease subunit [Metabacillus arenae]
MVDVNERKDISSEKIAMDSESLYEKLIDKKESMLSRILLFIVLIVSLITIFNQLLAAYYGAMEPFLQRCLTLIAFLILALILFPLKEKGQGLKFRLFRALDLIMIVLIIFSAYWIFHDWPNFTDRWRNPSLLDYAVSLFLILVTLELTRRTIGWVLVILTGIFSIHALFGEMFPGTLKAANIAPERLIEIIFMGVYGIFSEPIAVLGSYLLIFIAFGTILSYVGASNFFKDLAISLVGGIAGGAAHVATLSSAFLGSISGSPIANVMTTGIFTIPLMKASRFSSTFAGAVESVASTGGQLMPPIMGTAAFIMAAFIGVPYWDIVEASLLPSLLFYIAVFWTIFLYAKRNRLETIPKSERPSFRKTLVQGGHLLLPLIVITGAMAYGSSVIMSGVYGLFSLIVLGLIKPYQTKRLGAIKLVQAFQTSAINTVPVAMACGAAGIIVGVMNVSGLGDILSMLVMDISGGNIYIAIIVTAIVAIILGLGLPTPAVYVTMAITIVPALVNLGVDMLAAHFFVFYYGIVSGITPPVALTSYAASSISGADPNKTGNESFKLGVATYVLPIIFILEPALILQGTAMEIILVFILSLTVIFCLGITMSKWFLLPINLLDQIILIFGAVALIVPNVFTCIIGYLIVLYFITKQIMKKINSKDLKPSNELAQ